MKTEKITTKALDSKFNEGDDISRHVDWNSATRSLSLDLPIWAIKALDQESTRRGVARQALIKMWLIDRLDQMKEKQSA